MLSIGQSQREPRAGDGHLDERLANGGQRRPDPGGNGQVIEADHAQTLGDVEPRLARLFLKLADENGQPHADGVFIPLPLSRQEVADLTGTTIETTIRIMSRWGKQGVVRTEKDGFVVVDRAALEDLALT